MVSTQEQQQLERARLALVALDGPGAGAARRGREPDLPEPEPQLGTQSRPWWGRVRREHILLGTLGLIGLLVLAWYFLGLGRVAEVPVAQPVVEPPAPVAATSPAAMLRVHVLGEVTNPGVVSVPEGAIVQDALMAAGGLAPDADPGELNLAAPLSDGQQIIVGSAAQPRGEVLGPSGAAQETLINLNQASVDELQELPGVGPVLAQAIVTWREEHGPFTDIAQLEEVPGVGPKLLSQLTDLVML